MELTSTPISDDVAIGTEQSLGSAGDFTIDGTFASDGEADFTGNNIKCICRVRSTGDDSGLTFTFYGEDLKGNTISDAVSGTNGGYADTSIYFAKVDRVSSSGATDGNVFIGTCNNSVTPFLYLDQQRDLSLTGFSVRLSSGANFLYSMQVAHTSAPEDDTDPFVTFDPRLSSLRKSTSAVGATPSTGYRIRITEYFTGTLTFRVRQAGT